MILQEEFDCRLYEPRTSQAMGKGENAYIPLSLPSRESVLKPNSIRVLLGNLNLLELNKLLYRCSAEELADGCGFNTYQIPGWGTLVYCGFQVSFISLLSVLLNSTHVAHIFILFWNIVYSSLVIIESNLSFSVMESRYAVCV
ncbi:unnamed protein product [Trichobilharzia regenti]|nr:unnamed protein product [Trichobilharzia regenti]